MARAIIKQKPAKAGFFVVDIKCYNKEYKQGDVPKMQNQFTHALEELTDEQLNQMSDDEFRSIIDSLPQMTNNQVRQFMRDHNKSRPLYAHAIAAKKEATRKANKLARKARRNTRK